MLKNIRLDLSYDGTNYSGWQIQENANTVESELRKALSRLKVDYSNLHASGRTDSGVHALSQTVNFFTESSIPDDAFSKAINSVLPNDIVVKKSRRVGDDFHARYSALAKHYSYRVNLSKTPSPFEYRYSWHYPYRVDFKRILEASEFLRGRHDYKAFQKKGSSVLTTEREVSTIVPSLEGEILTLDFLGNGFLYNMVRILSGTIIEYASFQLEEEKLKRVFTEPKRDNAGITAPAKGLFLEGVFYTQDEIKERMMALESKNKILL